MPDTTIDINEITVKKFVETLRPEDPKIRAEIDMGYSYDSKAIILFEIRPFWNDPNQIDHFQFAKIKRNKTKNKWTLYWMRASGKWELYTPFPESTHLDEILQTIKKDKNACFFG